MKKTFKTTFTLLLAMLLIIAMATPAFAQGKVTYLGNADGFIYEPGSEYSPSDLFENFKGVMPGDKLTDTVLIKNEAAKNVTVKVYMRSLGAQEGSEEFLAQMQLTVDSKENNLFLAPSNETAQLTDWVFLGELSSGGEVLLDLTLDVPIEMGNEFANQIGYLDWQFMTEEIPVDSPDTGDSAMIFIYAGAAIMFAVIIAIVLVKKRKQEEN